MIFNITILALFIAFTVVVVADPAKYLRIKDKVKGINKTYKPFDCITCMASWSGFILTCCLLDYTTIEFYASIASSTIFGRIADKML
jgi:hypothetical protein